MDYRDVRFGAESHAKLMVGINTISNQINIENHGLETACSN